MLTVLMADADWGNLTRPVAKRWREDGPSRNKGFHFSRLRRGTLFPFCGHPEEYTLGGAQARADGVRRQPEALVSETYPDEAIP